MKLLDAKNIVKDILYSRQQVFKYCDKAGKQLARVLVENPITSKVIGMRKENGELTISPIQKQDSFANYYSNLYLSSNPSHSV